MMASVDGRIITGGWPLTSDGRRQYEAVHATYAPDAWICGRVTMEQHFAAGTRPDADVARTYDGPPREDFVAPGAHDSFAIAVSVTVSLMFVCVLLAAGMLALEREEHAFGRLVRGLVSRLALVGEKVVLAALCAFALGVVMVLGLSVFVDISWGQAPGWLLALLFGALAFSALGVAIGGLAREVRAASLLAFLLSLPIAFLALVPNGAVSEALFDVISVVSAAFPFKPTLEALDRTLNDSGQSVLGPLLHLVALVVAYLAVARLALRRFA